MFDIFFRINRLIPKHLVMVLLPFTLFLSFTNAHAEVFVSPTGNDTTGDGSIGNPYLSPQVAVNAADPTGDTVTFRDGTYPINSPIKIQTPNLTLRSHPGEWAVLTAPIDVKDIHSLIWWRRHSIGGKIQRLEVAGGYYYTIKFENLVWSQERSEHINRNYVVEDSVLRDSGRDLIKISPGIDNITIRRNHFARSGLRDAGNADGIDNVNSNNFIVQDNFFEDIATSVLYAKGGVKNAIIERNISINTKSGILLGYSTDNEFFDKDNLDENGRSIYENIDGIVRNNIIINTKRAGIGLFAANRPQVYNNTLINTATEHFASISIEPNIDPYASRGSSRDVTIRNNIVVQAADATNHAVRIRCHTGVNPCNTGLEGYLHMSNNIYYKQGAAPTFQDQRPDSKFSGDLAGWQAHINSDANSMVADPQLDENYHLTAASIAINAGYDIASIIDDYDGVARTDKFDIGADEYGSLFLPVLPKNGTIGTGAVSMGPDSTEPHMGPTQIARLTSKAATIIWSTNELASSEIEYGESTSYGSQLTTTTIPSHKHSFVLENLDPTTTYHYRVTSTDYAGNTSVSGDKTFTTPEIIYATITANVDGVGGSVLPAGNTTLIHGDNQTYQIQPLKGYNVAQVVVDGVDQGVMKSYDFDNIDAAHDITVKFEVLPTTTAAIPGSPLLYYTFNDASGGIVADLSGNNHHGVLTNGAVLGNGLGGKALWLDGKNDFMAIAEAAELNIMHTFSVGAWIKRERFLIGESIYDAGSNNSWGVKMRGGSHSFEYRVKSEDYSNTGAYAGVSDTNWHHVFMVKTGEKSEFYIDGQFVRKMPSPKDWILPSGVKKIGAETAFSKNARSAFLGRIDNFVLYDRALTAQEAVVVYENTGLTQEEIGSELPADPQRPEDEIIDDGKPEPKDDGLVVTPFDVDITGIIGVKPASGITDLDPAETKLIVKFTGNANYTYTGNKKLMVYELATGKPVLVIDVTKDDESQGTNRYNIDLSNAQLTSFTAYGVVVQKGFANTGAGAIGEVGPGIWTFTTGDTGLAAEDPQSLPTEGVDAYLEHFAGTRAEFLMFDNGFEQGMSSLVASNTKALVARTTDNAIFGNYAVDIEFNNYSGVLAGHSYKWGSKNYAKAIQVHAKVRIPEGNSSWAKLQYCAVVYYSEGDNKREETCQEIPGTQTGVSVVNVVHNLEPTRSVERVFNQIKLIDHGPFNVTIDDMHVVMHRVIDETEAEREARIKAEQEAQAEKERLAEEARIKAEQEAQAERERLAEEARIKAEQEAQAEKERLAEEARIKAEEEARREEENGGIYDRTMTPLAVPVAGITGVYPASGSVLDPATTPLIIKFAANTDFTYTGNKKLMVYELGSGREIIKIDPTNTDPQNGLDTYTIDLSNVALKSHTEYGVVAQWAFAIVAAKPWKTGEIGVGQWTFKTGETGFYQMPPRPISEGLSGYMLNREGTTAELLMVDNGFEQGLSSVTAPYSRASITRTSENAIYGEHSVAAEFTSYSSVVAGHTYRWGTKNYAKALQVHTKVNLPETNNPWAALQFCAVVYYSEGDNRREESCHDISGIQQGKRVLDVTHQLDPTRSVARVYSWFKHVGVGDQPFNVTLDDMHMVMHRTDMTP